MNILVPKFKVMPRWFERELRTGGLIQQHLERERHLQEQSIRRVAREQQGIRPNPRSDFKLLARVPANLFMRWKQVDPDFWRYDANLKSLRRDNDSLKPLIHV